MMSCYSLITVEEETKMVIVATIAWVLHKCSRAIMMALIFLIAVKPGFIHAVYMVFFLIYLLSHNIRRKIRKSLILLCEVHFALLYILQIDLISNALERKSSLGIEILLQLAIVQHTSSHPVGFSILKAGLNKSVLLSVYASSTTKYSCDYNPSYGFRMISKNVHFPEKRLFLR
ncbi:hypothetical protein Ddye_016737 [Dipteronia dyeriana]|uniref:Piezo-type mechanosensitive ion channel homolog domain-containing protein n=1 Tax=Dipteronia dyeriana TaxID=168575 RepID=A0AAD9X0C2_9ROSI|nr:hypothetical protein Ddye_016737 [Dipteronia dyeriana]